MKPKKAVNIVNKIFNDYWDKKTTSDEALVKLSENMKALKILRDKYALSDGDSRGGADTYGLTGEWKGHFDYISDRWMVRFRVQWLIDLIKYKRKHNDLLG